MGSNKKERNKNQKSNNLAINNDQLGENASEVYKSENYDNAGKNAGKKKRS